MRCISAVFYVCNVLSPSLSSSSFPCVWFRLQSFCLSRGRCAAVYPDVITIVLLIPSSLLYMFFLLWFSSFFFSYTFSAHYFPPSSKAPNLNCPLGLLSSSPSHLAVPLLIVNLHGHLRQFILFLMVSIQHFLHYFLPNAASWSSCIVHHTSIITPLLFWFISLCSSVETSSSIPVLTLPLLFPMPVLTFALHPLLPMISTNLLSSMNLFLTIL